MTRSIALLYADDRLVVVHKPAGALVHRSALERHAPLVMLQALRDQLGQRVYPVHRLDRPTSGALLFALDEEMASALNRQFRDHGVYKRYLAVVRGIGPEAATLDRPLRDEEGPRPKAEMPALAAVTRVRRLDSVELPVRIDRYPTSRYSLMEALPEGGRRHQIRRHLSGCGHPVIGDAKHGKGVHNRFFRDHLEAGRLLLAAVALGFRHPLSGRWLTVSAAPQEDFTRLMTRLGWSGHRGVDSVSESDEAPGTHRRHEPSTP